MFMVRNFRMTHPRGLLAYSVPRLMLFLKVVYYSVMLLQAPHYRSLQFLPSSPMLLLHLLQPPSQRGVVLVRAAPSSNVMLSTRIPVINQHQPQLHRFTDAAVLHIAGSSSVLIAHQHQNQHQHQHQHQNNHYQNEQDNNILVVVSVDGTLAGIDRSSGQLLWKRPSSSSLSPKTTDNHQESATTTAGTTSHTGGRMPLHKTAASPDVNHRQVFPPLLSTTTTAQTAAASTSLDYAAVPCINGNVYLTGHSQTVSTSIKELVRRAPFLDPQGRFYAGTQQTTAVAIHPQTGQVLNVMGYDGHDNEKEKENHGEPQQQRKHSSSSSSTTTTPPWKQSTSLPEETILWIGRVDYSVTVQDARTGRKSVEFSVAEIMPVHDLRTGTQEDVHGDSDQGADSQIVTSQVNERLISTPSGTLAMVNLAGQVQWIVEESFSTPIAYGISSNGKQLFYVDIVPDVVVPSSNDVEYLSRQLERQVELIDSDTFGRGSDEQTIVGRLHATGQLYALPLGRQQFATTASSSLPHLSSHHAAAIASSNKNHKTTVPRLAAGRTAHSLSHHTNDDQSFTRRPCHPTSSNFPSCLVDHHKHQPPRLEYFAQGQDKQFSSEGVPPPTEKTNGVIATTDLVEHYHLDYPLEEELSEQYGVESMVYHPDYGYVKFSSRPKARQHKLWRIMGSWLPATIALIFVLSFELGRRKRLQDLHGEISTQATSVLSASLVTTPNNSINDNTMTTTITASPVTPDVEKLQQQQQQQPQQVIQVSDQVLGYGGQGTVVYKGVLDGRDVAVKRMLKAYHASADREIRLLIESDGHPNVVRYFLKEVRGDFVYLALELCDLSLHDLIGVLREVPPTLADSLSVRISATKTVLLQISSGVRHLHSLRIAHRDLKPANILLAVNKRKKNCSETLETFVAGSYVAKISDMGLGKQIMGPSSLGGSTLGIPVAQGSNGKAAASSIGVGPGTVGWQAPEVMATRWVASDASAKSGDSNAGHPNHDASALEFTSTNPRTSRAVDIFSLGCIFYSTLVPGFHPFGEWYEREANIVHNRPTVDALEQISPEAFDLVRAMLSRDPRLRPTAKQICEHPFFWNSGKKLSFLCDFSDRLETDTTVPTSIQLVSSLSIERGAVDVVGTSWDTRLDGPLISNMQRFRTYDPSSVRDLLRLIRNKHHHFDELPEDFRASKVANQDSLLEYFEAKFPRLLIHCWNCCRFVLTVDDQLKGKYNIPTGTGLAESIKPLFAISAAPESVAIEGSLADDSPDAIDLPESDCFTKVGDETDERILSEAKPVFDSLEFEMVLLESVTPAAKSPQCIVDTEPSLIAALEAVDDVIAWVGSTTAKELNCRGWNRSDAEWARRIDPVYRKKDQNLRRASEDPKYRTRLCNHWDLSMGTFCAMRKRNKCIFAHGPAELRIKEGKKNRWGKLVDKNGDNKNPCHSGGEDTYGAARSIESVRKEEGKWSTGEGSKGVKGKKPSGTKSTKKAPPTQSD